VFEDVCALCHRVRQRTEEFLTIPYHWTVRHRFGI